MVIANITRTKNAHAIILSADITFAGKKTEKAYLTTDVNFDKFVATDASPFLAAMLIPAMKKGESITVEGSVSKKLYANIKTLQKLLLSWNLGFSKVPVHVAHLTEESGNPSGVASFFTAGVDSFYTYLKHKKDKKPIQYFVMAHGFDIPLANKTFFAEVKKTVTDVARREKITPIFLTTNLGEMIEKHLVWDFGHGGALAAAALFLRKGLKKVYIAGAVRNDQLFPYGTHPKLDLLWSTEKQTLQSDGGEKDRLGKVTDVISTSPLALAYLRVCAQNLKGKYNCSRCYKCLMTIMSLAAVDALKNAKTFDRKLHLDAIANMYYDYKLKYNVQGEQVLALLKKLDRLPELQEAIELSLYKSKHPSLLRQVAKIVATIDQKYNERRIYSFVFQMNEQNDRSALFKFLLRKGILK